MIIAQSIAANMLVVTAARILGSVFAFASTAFIARTLEPEGYGDFSMTLAFFFIFVTLADFGLYSILIREISKPGADEKHLASHIFTMRIVALIVLLCFGVGIIQFFPYSQEVKSVAAVAALSYFFLSASHVLLGLFQRHLKMAWTAIAELMGRAILLCLSFALYILSGSLIFFLGSLALAALAQFLLTFIFARRLVQFSLRYDRNTWIAILKTALPISISILFVLIYFKTDTILLSLFAPNPRHDTGIYGAAYKLLESIIFFPSAFVGLVVPLLTAAAVTDPKRFQRIFQRAWETLWIFIAPVIVGGFFVAPHIVAVLGGAEFAEAATPFRILLFAIGFIFFGALLGQTVIVLNLQRQAIAVYFLGMVISVGANLLLIPKFSYNAAAAVTVLAELIIDVGLLVLLFRHAKIMPEPRRAFQPIAAAVMMGLGLHLVADKAIANWGLPMLAPVTIGAAAIYFLILAFLGGIKRADFSLFLARKAE